MRQGTGNARANMRAFLNGLHDGDGTVPAVRGTVFVAGIGQTTTDLSLYQARLQDWYEDSAFWSDLGRFASDWSQEVYGDVRNYAVPGVTRDARRDLLNEYLQHESSLAGAAPSSGDAARAFLRDFSSPLANAAWRYDAAFGWTDVPVELMQDYVSAQTYAMRFAGNSRFGYAWSPKNLRGVPAADFNAQTDAVLVRLAAAISDSGDLPEAACGAVWCAASLDGATATTAWRTFGTWKPSRLAFTSPEQTVSPGAASAPLTIELQTSAQTAYPAGIPVPVALSSSSPTAELSSAASGPWSATLTVPIVSGASSVSFYVRDAGVGSTTITAAAVGKTAATQTLTVAEPPSEPPAPAPAPSPPAAESPTPPVVVVQPTPPPAPPVATPALIRPALRTVGAPARVTRARGLATLFVRFSLGGSARLEASVTPLGSARPLTLLAGTTLAGARLTRPQARATARVPRAAVYTFQARVGASRLVKGRSYLVKLTVVDADGRRRSLTIRVRA